MADFHLATFVCDITPPVGHPCMGGGIAPVAKVLDPLSARGFILFGGCDPIVVCSLDWCEMRNGAHDGLREALADVAHTAPARVLVTSIHQHDAPVADLDAQRILEEHKCEGTVCQIPFVEKAIASIAEAARQAYAKARPVSHLGMGEARVERVASNRRFFNRKGALTFERTSSTKNPEAQEADEGLIDPNIKMLSFWDGDSPVAVLSCYAVHPMSYYGRGEVSADFVGAARDAFQKAEGVPHHIYASGCSGNVTAGKFNAGTPEDRLALRDRLADGMGRAWRATKRETLESVSMRSVPLMLEPRQDEGYAEKDELAKLAAGVRPFDQCLAAMGLAWRRRCAGGRAVDVQLVNFGPAQLLLLPAEAYVEYQLAAQAELPGGFVMTMGYGECGAGYIPTEKAWAEGDSNLHQWCWVGPGSEGKMRTAIKEALR